MIELDSVYGGPHVHKTKRANPTEILISLIDENPGAKRDEIKSLFWDRIQNDEDYLRPMVDYFFLNAWKSLHDQKGRLTPEEKARRAAEKEAEDVAIEGLVEQIKSKLVLEFVHPVTGKKMRDSTCAECAYLGGIWGRAGKLGGPNEIVGNLITDGDANRVLAIND